MHLSWGIVFVARSWSLNDPTVHSNRKRMQPKWPHRSRTKRKPPQILQMVSWFVQYKEKSKDQNSWSDVRWRNAVREPKVKNRMHAVLYCSENSHVATAKAHTWEQPCVFTQIDGKRRFQREHLDDLLLGEKIEELIVPAWFASWILAKWPQPRCSSHASEVAWRGLTGQKWHLSGSLPATFVESW